MLRSKPDVRSGRSSACSRTFSNYLRAADCDPKRTFRIASLFSASDPAVMSFLPCRSCAFPVSGPEYLPRGLVRSDVVPIIGDAEAWARRHWDGSLLIDGFELVRVAAGIDRRDRVRAVGPDERDLVVVRVAGRGHAVPVGRAAGMDLDIDAEGLGEVCDFHGTGDAEVVFGIGAEHVGAAGDQEIGLDLEAAQILGLQDRGLQHLAQLLVGEGRDAAIPHRVLVPEIAALVAGATHIKGVCEGAQLVRGFSIKVMRSPTTLATCSTFAASSRASPSCQPCS